MVSYAIRMTWLLVVSRPDLWTMQYAIRMIYGVTIGFNYLFFIVMIYDVSISYPDDIINLNPMSTGLLSLSRRLKARAYLNRMARC